MATSSEPIPLRPSEVRIRRVRPTDAPDLERFYAALSEDSRLRRFLGVVRGLNARQASTFCTPDDDHREGFVAVVSAGSPPAGRIVGHLCLEPDGTDTAEVAIAVADDWQRRGLGRRLMEAGLRWARRAGVTRFTATMFADNAGIHRLLLGLGLPAETRLVIAGVSAITIYLTPVGRAAA
jgi:acetyltransferase